MRAISTKNNGICTNNTLYLSELGREDSYVCIWGVHTVGLLLSPFHHVTLWVTILQGALTKDKPPS